MKIVFSSQTLPRTGNLVVFAGEGGKLTGPAADVDKKTGGQLARAIKATGFEGKKDQTVDLLAPTGGYSRVVLMGLGKTAGLVERDIEYIGGSIAGLLQAAKIKDAAIAVSVPGLKDLTEAKAAALMASGASLRTYTFDGYKTKKNGGSALASLDFRCADAARATKEFQPYDAIRQGNHLARNLVNEPANILVPAEFAKRAGELKKAGIKVEIFTPQQMKRLGMGALLGVAQGSEHEARMVVMRWDGGKRGDAPVAFIGKGVTFDTGGVSIKPAAGMEDMKGDMAGAACVTGLMLALAKRKGQSQCGGLQSAWWKMPSTARHSARVTL